MILATVLLLIGLAFVLAEVFFPSLGMFGLIALGCLIIADIIAFEEHDAIGWTFIGAEIVLIPAIVHMGFKVLPKLPFGRRMILAGPVTAPGGSMPDYERLVQQHGVALTDLRPAGTARFGEERVTVVAIGGLVAEHAPIVVVDVEGSEVRVRALPPQGTPA